MGIEYYAFALFIAGLICLIAILAKVLFSNVKSRRQLLDERETKILQLYQTVESIMEDFNDQVKAAIDEIKEYELRAVKREALLAMKAEAAPEPAKAEHFEKLPRAERIDPGRMRAAGDVISRAERIVKRDTLISPEPPVGADNGAVFQRLFDETAEEAAAEMKETTTKQARKEAILALAEEGKTDAQIARELSITQNEVKLVIGLTRKK